MILTCPECDAKFKLDASLLPETGAKVKCSSCQAVWFQKPEQADIPDDAAFSEELSDIPEKKQEDLPTEEKIQEQAIDPQVKASKERAKALREAREAEEKKKKKKRLGYAASVGVFFLILIYLFVNGAAIARAHLSMHAFYGLFGIEHVFPGQGFVFDQVHAEVKEGVLHLEGSLVNLTSRDVPVPSMTVSVENGVQEVLTHWVIMPSQAILEAESSLHFQSQHNIDDVDYHGAADIVIEFVLDGAALDSKIDVGDDENSHALHQDDEHHPNAHVEASKSHSSSPSAHQHEEDHHDSHVKGDQADHSSDRHH